MTASDELRECNGNTEFHPGYHARQLDVNTAHGVYSRLDTIKRRMQKRADCPSWLLVQLDEAMRKMDCIIPVLEQHRDELKPSALRVPGGDKS